MKKLVVLLFPFIASSQIDNNKLQEEFIKIMNSDRSRYSFYPIQISSDATLAAKIQSDYIASTFHLEGRELVATCGHDNPNFPKSRDRVLEINPDLNPKLVVENVAGRFEISKISEDTLAQLFFNQWKKSPGHYTNMLDAYTYCGIYVSVKTISVKITKSQINTNTFELETVFEEMPQYYYSAALVFIK